MNLKIVGILLYWCEGSKRERDRRVEFANSDPKMIAAFMQYLRTKDIDEKRIRVRMMLHRQDDELQCRNFWRKVTSLDDSNFISAVVKKTSLVRHPLPYGTITIQYNSIELLRLINSEIRELIERI